MKSSQVDAIATSATNTTYQICARCIMDTSDPEIVFDEQGLCNHCRDFDLLFRPKWYRGDLGRKKLQAIVAEIKNASIGKEYDSILGLSGGVDSSYLAYQAKILGLRPLVVHVDGGWNSDLAVKNIEQIVKVLGFDLHTEVIDWEEMKDLQVAFLRSGVANCDVPQDHAFTATLYAYAAKNKIPYVLSGSNYATESILPSAWGHNAMDLRHVEAIHRKFGRRPLVHFPRLGFFRYYIYDPYIRRMHVIRLLNFMEYDRAEAMRTLEKELGWRDYGAKHCESRFTKFFQGYYLPKRFGFDKRRAHLSSLIVSEQMTREEALREMLKEPYAQNQIREDRELVLKKLGLTEKEFSEILVAPIKTFKDYPTNEALVRTLVALGGMAKKIGFLNRFLTAR